MRIKTFILFILALLGCIAYISMPLGPFDSRLFDAGIIVAIISVVIFFNYSQHSPLKGYWIRPSILFLIGFFAVNFQYLADYRFGLKSDGSRMILIGEILNHCMLLGVVGILSFVAGYVFKPIRENIPLNDTITYGKVNIPTSFLVVLNVVVFVAFLLTIDIVSFVSGADYGNAERVNSHFEGLLYVSNALIVCNVCIKSAGQTTFKQYIKSFPTISLIVILLYMVMRLLSGDRGPFIYTMLLLVFGYAYSTRNKIKLRRVLIYLFSAAILISVVGIARSLELSQRFHQRMGSAFEMFTEEGRFGERGERTVSPLTEEMGFSFLVNQTDVNAIERKGEKLNYGLYTVTEVVSSIPFMPSFLQNTLGMPEEKFSSSGFANYHYFGGYERNWGIGTTIVGDFYLQFGVWGVLIGLFITGLFFRFLDINLYCREKTLLGAYTILLVILFSAKSIYMPRAMLTVELPRFVIGSIILFALGVRKKKVS